jgi:hypothetical protein
MLNVLSVSVRADVFDKASTAKLRVTELVVRVITMAKYVANTIKVPIQSNRMPNHLSYC